MPTTTYVPDGSAAADARTVVRIDREAQPYRWRCPNGHCVWEPTNNHVWCKSCRRASETGDDVEAEHWEILDVKTGELVPWSAVRMVDDD